MPRLAYWSCGALWARPWRVYKRAAVSNRLRRPPTLWILTRPQNVLLRRRLELGIDDRTASRSRPIVGLLKRELSNSDWRQRHYNIFTGNAFSLLFYRRGGLCIYQRTILLFILVYIKFVKNRFYYNRDTVYNSET